VQPEDAQRFAAATQRAGYGAFAGLDALVDEPQDRRAGDVGDRAGGLEQLKVHEVVCSVAAGLADSVELLRDLVIVSQDWDGILGRESSTRATS
jgi:hypothetical protein